jgi:hypothetical protein
MLIFMLDYFFLLSISGVFVLFIMAVCCFLNIEVFNLDEDRVEERGTTMMICVTVRVNNL